MGREKRTGVENTKKVKRLSWKLGRGTGVPATRRRESAERSRIRFL